MKTLTNLQNLKPEQWNVGKSSPALDKSRSQAWQSFLQHGLPTTHDESWHYTDLRKFLDQTPQAAKNLNSELQESLADWRGAIAVFVDGQYQPEKSRLPKNVEVVSLNEALNYGLKDLSAADLISFLQSRAERASREHGAILDLQQALLNSGIVIRVAANTSAEPLKLQMQWSSVQAATLGTLTQLVWVGQGSKLTLFEENLTVKNLTTTLWTHLELAANAKVEYVRLQQNQNDAVSLGLVSVQQQADSEFSAVGLLAGGRLGRETWVFDQVGTGCTSRLKTLQLGYGKTQLDLRTAIHHQMAMGQSEQRARTVAADQSRVVFNGKIVISKDAQMVNSSQLTQGLLLGEQAEIDNKPQLEIYADNVKASHGATVGQMDEEELFYLQSRGLTRTQSEQMLGEAFARDVVGKISDRDLRLSLERWLSHQLLDLLQSGMTL